MSEYQQPYAPENHPGSYSGTWSGDYPGPVTIGRDHPDHPDNRVKVGHLVVGLVLVGLAGTWALAASDTVSGVSGAVALPLVLVLAGALGLVAMVVGGVRNRRRLSRTDQHDTAYSEPVDTTHTETDTDTDTDTDNPEDTTVLGTYSEEENR